MKNGQPYCKDDFYKRFAKTRCANCELGKKDCDVHNAKSAKVTNLEFELGMDKNVLIDYILQVSHQQQ